MQLSLRQLFSSPGIFILLGFSSGLPLALVGSTLQAWFAISGIDVVTIGTMSLVGLPYLFKFFWAPYMDRYAVLGMGRRRGWMMATQLGLMVMIACLGWLTPDTHTAAMAALAVVVAFLSATQDIAIDAYRVDLLQPEQRGVGTAISIAGYRLAMLVSGGFALLMANWLGWATTYWLMAALMGVGVMATLWGPSPQSDISPVTSSHAHQNTSSMSELFFRPLQDYFRRRHAVILLVFLFLYKFAEMFTTTSGPLTNTFLLRGVGFDLAMVGTVNKIVGLVATMCGVGIAGWSLSRFSAYRVLMAFGVLQAIANTCFFALAIVGKHVPLFVFSVMLDNVSAGMGATAITVLVMGLCNKRFSATQFAMLSAVATSSRVVVGPIGGILVKHMGWDSLFLASFFVALVPLLLLKFLRDDVNAVTQTADLEREPEYEPA